MALEPTIAGSPSGNPDCSPPQERLGALLGGARAIGIVRLGSIGDVLASAPVAPLLRDLAPGARLVWIAHPESARILRCMPAIDEVIELERRSVLTALPRWRRKLRGSSLDLVIDLHGNLKSGVVDLLTGAPSRLGFHRKDCREHWNPLATNHKLPRLASGQKTLRALEAAWCLGHAEPRARWDFVFPRAAVERAESVLATFSSAAPLAVLQLGRPRDVRSWPVASYVETVRRLEGLGWGALVVGGPAEVPTGRELSGLLGSQGLHPRLEVGTLSLEELGALLQILARRPAASSAFVGPDSGMLHLAHACGLRSVGLFGPHDPERTGPVGAPSVALYHPEAAPCIPCGRRECSQDVPQRCLRAIRPAEVAAAVTGTRAPDAPADHAVPPAAEAVAATAGAVPLGLAVLSIAVAAFTAGSGAAFLVHLLAPAGILFLTALSCARRGGGRAGSIAALALASSGAFLLPGWSAPLAWLSALSLALFEAAYPEEASRGRESLPREVLRTVVLGAVVWLAWSAWGVGGLASLAVSAAIFQLGEKRLPAATMLRLGAGALLGATLCLPGKAVAGLLPGIEAPAGIGAGSVWLPLLLALPFGALLPCALLAHLRTRRFREDLGFADRRWRLPKAIFVGSCVAAVVFPLPGGAPTWLAAFPGAAALLAAWLERSLAERRRSCRSVGS